MESEASRLRRLAEKGRRLVASSTDAMAIDQIGKYAMECDAEANRLDELDMKPED